jgi:hypothetical protein
MPSATDIANRALQKLGSARIMALTDPGRNAVECAGCYEAVRDAELRRHPWSFAMRRAVLAAETGAAAWGYAHAFPLPADCLRLVEVDGSSAWDPSDYRGQSRPAYRLEGQRILTDQDGPLPIRYLAREEDTGRFDPCFAEVLATRMAAELAEPLTQSLQKKQMALSEYKDAIREARRINAIEGPGQTAPDDSWIMGRL